MTYPTRIFLVSILAFAWYSCTAPAAIYPERKDIVETVYASGKIISENEYNLSALCNGTIVKKLVSDGDTVRKGQLLYLVSDEDARQKAEAALKNFTVSSTNISDRSPLLNDLKLSLQNAEIRVRNDSLVYYRWKELWSENIGTRNNLDNVYANYQVSLNQKKIAEQRYMSGLNDAELSHSNAKSQLTAARKGMEDYYIRSNRNGVVYQTLKEVGEAVRNNEVVALVGTSGRLLIRLAVDQQDIDKIRLGQQVLLQADATGSRVFQAVISYIYPVMNEVDQTFRIEARFTGETPPSFIHSQVEANIIVQNKGRALVLPRTVFAAKDSLWIYDKGKEKKVFVQTGISTLDYVEIVAGVNEKTPVKSMDKK